MAKLNIHKNIFKRLSLAFIGLATIFVAAGYAINTINKNIHDANAENGAIAVNIEVNPNGEDPEDTDYPYEYYNDEWLTHYFYANLGNGDGFTAFCAQPSIIDYPEGDGVSMQVLADNNTNRLVKLLIYIATANTDATNTLMSSWYSWLPSEYQNEDGYYVYTHATIGYIFNNEDDTGLEEEDIENIVSIKNQLQQMIDNNDSLWLIAQNYDLYGTSGSNDTQIVVGIRERESSTITVHKCDKELEPTCSTSVSGHPAQGGGSLAGITFTLYDNNGAVVTSATTNRDGIATFANLPVGVNYSVRETATNSSYNLTDSEAKTINNLTTDGAKVAFSDYVIRGDVTFKKVDENGNPMANVAFTIASNTTGERHRVVTDSNGVVDTGNSYIPHTTGTNGYDSITGGSYIHQNYGTWFNGVDPDSGLEGASANNAVGALPYDTYTITELECDANRYCDYTGSSRQFSITTNNELYDDIADIENDCAEFGISTSATDTADGDKIVEASSTSGITDTITYCARTGLTYTIQGSLMYSTGEPVTVGDVPVQQEITVTPTNACGNTATMTFELDTSELAGKSIVVFEKLLYNGEVVADHSNPNDTDQTVTIISLDTYALDKSDSDKEVLATKDATVTDHIKYCLVAGTEYTIVGTLMNKNTGEPIVVKDALVQSSTTLTPTENCGDLYLDFDFDATGMGGTEIVVFEKAGVTSPTPLADDDICLAHDATDPNTCTSYFHTLISHADLDDATQTVLITTPEPAPKSSDTGRLTAAVDSSGGTGGGIPLAVASIAVVAAGYFGIRLFSRKRFLGKVK